MDVEQITAAETVAMIPALRVPGGREVCAPGSYCADFMMTSSIRGARYLHALSQNQ
jgi:hypothetical protein